MPLDFEKHRIQGINFLEKLAHDIGEPGNTEKAGRILTSVLHALRDHLNNEDAMDLMNHLPFFLRPIYTVGWKEACNKKSPDQIFSYTEFIGEVMREDGPKAGEDFSVIDQTESYIRDVFRCLGDVISRESKLEIEAILPDEVDKVWMEVNLLV